MTYFFQFSFKTFEMCEIYEMHEIEKLINELGV